MVSRKVPPILRSCLYFKARRALIDAALHRRSAPTAFTLVFIIFDAFRVTAATGA